MNSNTAEQIENAFRQDAHLAFRKIDVSQKNGGYIINGNVESYFEKQLAQETLRCVVGLQKIDNQLEVNWN